MRVHKMRYCSAATEAGSFKVTSLLSTRALFTRLSPCSITTGTPSSVSRAVILSSSILFLFNQVTRKSFLTPSLKYVAVGTNLQVCPLPAGQTPEGLSLRLRLHRTSASHVYLPLTRGTEASTGIPINA